MNLIFAEVSRKTSPDGRVLALQRAMIPAKCPEFWAMWRTASKDDPTSIKGVGTLRRETGGWMLYRVFDTTLSRLHIPPNKPRYTLRNREGLLPYQPRSVALLCASMLSHGHAVDASDTGTGKTYCALAVARELNLKPVIVCKLAGIESWRKAARVLNVGLFDVVNYEQLRMGKKFYCSKTYKSYTWNLPKECLIIFDEVHSAAQAGTLNNAVYRAAKSMPTLAISATLADRPGRMETHLEVLGAMTPDTFREWLKLRGQYCDAYGHERGIAEASDMLEIHKFLFPAYGCRISYDDPDVRETFPECSPGTMRINIGDKAARFQHRAYETLVSKIESYRSMGRQADILVADLRYRQMVELLKVPALVDMTKDLLSQGNCVCIFVNFRETMSHLSKSLHTTSCIYGSQDPNNRKKILDDFQSNKNRLIILMVDAGGQSLDLHDLSGGYRRVSLICPTYNPVTLRQVFGRTRRAGSKSTPVILMVYAAKTIEEKVAERVEGKLKNLDALNDGDINEPELIGVRK